MADPCRPQYHARKIAVCVLIHSFFISSLRRLWHEILQRTIYKNHYTHTHKQEKKNYITLLPLGIEEKKMTKKTKTETYIHGDVHLSMT